MGSIFNVTPTAFQNCMVKKCAWEGLIKRNKKPLKVSDCKANYKITLSLKIDHIHTDLVMPEIVIFTDLILLVIHFYRTVLTFRNWLDLLDVVQAFWIIILKIFKSLLTQGYRHRKLRKTIGKFFRSYSELLSKFGEISFHVYFLKESLPRSSGDLVYKLRRVKYEANFVS